MESKDSFIFKRAGYRKSYAMQNKAGLHDFVLGGASFMQRRRFFYSVVLSNNMDKNNPVLSFPFSPPPDSRTFVLYVQGYS